MSSDTTIQFTVQATPAQVFTTIVDVRAWWSGDIHGPTDQLGGEFSYRHDDLHRTVQRVTALDPHRRVARHVVQGHLAFVRDTDASARLRHPSRATALRACISTVRTLKYNRQATSRLVRPSATRRRTSSSRGLSTCGPASGATRRQLERLVQFGGTLQVAHGSLAVALQQRSLCQGLQQRRTCLVEARRGDRVVEHVDRHAEVGGMPGIYKQGRRAGQQRHAVVPVLARLRGVHQVAERLDPLRRATLGRVGEDQGLTASQLRPMGRRPPPRRSAPPELRLVPTSQGSPSVGCINELGH